MGRRLLVPSALAAFLLALASPGGAATARAATAAQTRARLGRVRNQIAQERALRVLHQAEETRAYHAFTAAAAAFDQARARLHAIGGQMAVLGQAEARARAGLAAARARASQARLALGATEVDWQEQGVLGPWAALLSAQSVDGFLSRLYLVDQLIGYQGREVAALAAATHKARDEARRLAAEVAAVSREEASARFEARSLQRAGTAERAAMARDKALVAADSGALEQLEEASANLVAVLEQEAHASTVDSGQGARALRSVHFIWPVDGPITSPFGMRLDPIMHQWWLHTGVDIGVPEGTPVHAACSGTVLFSGAMTGYGNVVIIDCGGGISTLYAHAETLIAHAGEPVLQGQVIDLAGMTGWATGPHVHFEIRVDGRPVNPVPYLPVR